MNIYYVTTTVSWVEQIDPEIGGPRFEEDDAAIIAAPSRGSAWSQMLGNAREAGYSLDFTSKHSVQLLAKDVDRAAGFVTDGEEAERYWVAAGRPVATDIVVAEGGADDE